MTCFLPPDSYRDPGEGCEFRVTMKLSRWQSKKHGTSASDDSAKDAVQVDETVRVPQNLINGIEVKGIDVRIDLEAVLALAKALN